MGNYGACSGCGGVPTPVACNTGIGAVGYDADPITPGIQAQPGVVTPVGPPRVVGRQGFGQSNVCGPMSPRFAMGDIDPITPGYQTRPGVITATGPTVYGGGMQPIRRC